MTALATVPEYTPQAVEYPIDPTGGRLVAWASALQAAGQIGKALCQTAFAPTHFRGKPEDTAAAILYGDELGLTPAQSIRSVFVIGGTPSLYARTMVAIVLAHGHEMWTEKKTDAEVVVCGRRKGSSNVEREAWTTARATRAGYTSNKKYATDPQAMLYARAAADIARRIAPDALAGIAYTVEEMELEEAPTVTVTRTQSAGARKVERKSQPEPDLDAPAAIEAPEKSTKEQREQIRTLFDTKGVASGDRPRIIEVAVGRPIVRMDHLTAAEAAMVLTAIAQSDAPEVTVEDPPATDDLDPTLDAEWGQS